MKFSIFGITFQVGRDQFNHFRAMISRRINPLHGHPYWRGFIVIYYRPLSPCLIAAGYRRLQFMTRDNIA